MMGREKREKRVHLRLRLGQLRAGRLRLREKAADPDGLLIRRNRSCQGINKDCPQGWKGR